MKYTHELQRNLLIAVFAGLTAFGCAQSEAPLDPSPSTGGGGDKESAPPPTGAGAGASSAGAAGATSGEAGAAGSGSGSAGANGVAGNPGTAGTAGTAGAPGNPGRGGTSGAPDGGAPDGGGTDGGAAPTFTQVYTTVLSVYCAGSSCHSPGTKGGVNFATQSTAYTTLKSKVIPGNGTGSNLYTLVNTGKMPEGKPKLSAANIALIKAWIDAGALND
jgi:hypothetical protein